MSRFDYVQSQRLSGESFYPLLMAAMRRAGTKNLALLTNAFPEVWYELQARYNAPGGYLECEERNPED